jgi:hypothetical protein
MPILETPMRHFQEDIERARQLVAHADPMAASVVREDIMRAAWMTGVGAADAFFCDAYADLIARTLRAKQAEPNIEIPDRLLNLKVPVVTVIRDAPNENWRWRMVARGLIEDETVLSIGKIKKLFNHFFRSTHKLFSSPEFDRWVLHADWQQRLFGINKTDYRRLAANDLTTGRTNASNHFGKRYEYIFQRRHDCIHNCDRPKSAIDTTHIRSADYVGRVLFDITFLATRCHEEFLSEFPTYLTDLGFNAVTRNRVGC